MLENKWNHNNIFTDFDEFYFDGGSMEAVKAALLYCNALWKAL